MSKTPGDPPVWKSKGYMNPEQVDLPTKERLEQGPVAIIECPQQIPCDPCSDSCPVGAISMEGINGLPAVDPEKCTGCGVCVENCPGLAIFVLDCSPEVGCDITLPYEFDLPEVGEEVLALDRKGQKVTTAEVKRVKSKQNSSGDTSTVTVHIPEEYINRVRNIRRQG